MKKIYHITGMTCGSCVSKVKSALLKLPEVNGAEVQLESPQATLEFNDKLSEETLNTKVKEAGNYTIQEIDTDSAKEEVADVSVKTYKPLILIITFIFGVSILAQYPFDIFSWMLWMQHFMAGFFIVFSFFKLLNLKGFADSYQMYDVIAKRWNGWGLIYPFVELTLGVAYLMNYNPFITNVLTIIILGISSVGVIESNLNNRKIKCACLGDVFNLPMSTVTIIEDLTMVAMAIIMLMV